MSNADRPAPRCEAINWAYRNVNGHPTVTCMLDKGHDGDCLFAVTWRRGEIVNG